MLEWVAICAYKICDLANVGNRSAGLEGQFDEGDIIRVVGAEDSQVGVSDRPLPSRLGQDKSKKTDPNSYYCDEKSVESWMYCVCRFHRLSFRESRGELEVDGDLEPPVLCWRLWGCSVIDSVDIP